MMKLWLLLFHSKSFKLRTRKTYHCFSQHIFRALLCPHSRSLSFLKLNKKCSCLLEKGTDDGKIREIESKEIETLSKRDISTIPFRPIMHVHEKWTEYFIGAEDAKIQSEIKLDSRFVHFSDVALINVDITTGSNKFSLSTTTPLTSMNWIVAPCRQLAEVRVHRELDSRNMTGKRTGLQERGLDYSSLNPISTAC